MAASTNLDAVGHLVATRQECEEILRTIKRELARYEEHVGDHFGLGPDDVDWGNVGDAGALKGRLEQIKAILTGEGVGRP